MVTRSRDTTRPTRGRWCSCDCATRSPSTSCRAQVSGGTPFNPVRIRGDFLALSDEAGASAPRMAFDWETI